MSGAAPASAQVTTAGTLLGGRVRYEQLANGYRTGIEPVFLAAAVPARPGDRVLEGGTGAGAALLCLLHRVPGVQGVGLERDPAVAAVARRNATGVPGLSIITAAVEAPGAVGAFHHVCANPPWHDPAGTPSPHPGRQAALRAPDAGTLAAWTRALCRHLLPGGTATLIVSARLRSAAVDALGVLGAVRLRPLLPRPGRAAKILLVHAAGHTTGPVRELPGLILHAEGGGYAAEAEAVLRGAAALSWDG